MDIIAEYRYDGMKHIEFKFKNKTCIALMNEDESKRNGKQFSKLNILVLFLIYKTSLLEEATLLFLLKIETVGAHLTN